MKVKLDELKKAISWIEVNSKDLSVGITGADGRLYINCTDKYDSSVEIVIFDEKTAVMPKIKKTDILR